MSKVENFEQEVQALTPSELAAFRRWFLSSMHKFGTGKLKRIFETPGWTSSQRKLWRHIAPGRVRSFETFCRPEFLELLSNPSEIGSRTC